MITKRTLDKWRKEALLPVQVLEPNKASFEEGHQIVELNQRILRMTQELLDAHLIRKK